MSPGEIILAVQAHSRGEGPAVQYVEYAGKEAWPCRWTSSDGVEYFKNGSWRQANLYMSSSCYQFVEPPKTKHELDIEARMAVMQKQLDELLLLLTKAVDNVKQ